MNKRIEELSKESGLDIYGLGLDRAKWIAAVERFSELIIAECTKAVLATPCPYDEGHPLFPQLAHTWFMANVESRRQILEHFGVKDEIIK